MRKSGAGQHNWGSLADERDLEYAAMQDEQYEIEEEGTKSSQCTSPSSSCLATSCAYPSAISFRETPGQ